MALALRSVHSQTEPKNVLLLLPPEPPLSCSTEGNYQALTLRNGLRVLCCSDPNADRAAAALDVHVGARREAFRAGAKRAGVSRVPAPFWGVLW